MDDLTVALYEALPEKVRPVALLVLGVGAVLSLIVSALNGLERALRSRGETPPRGLVLTLALLNPLAGNFDKGVEMLARAKRKNPRESTERIILAPGEGAACDTRDATGARERA